MSYNLKVIKDYPIAFWPLDEYSGSTASDISGCGNNGTYVGSPASNILPLVPGGVSGTKITNIAYVTLPTSKDYYGAEVSNGLGNKYSSDNDFSLEVWIHSSIQTTAETTIFADPTNNIGLFWENGDIIFKVSNVEKVRWALTNTNKVIHLVGIYSVNSIQLFIDSNLVNSKEITNGFKFTNTTLNLQIGPTSNASDSFVVDAPAVYRYSLPLASIVRHFVDGNVSSQPIHVAYPEEGTLFTCTDSRHKIVFDYIYGINRSFKDFVDENTYYDNINNYVSFYQTDTATAKTFTFQDSFLIPTESGLTTSKIEWRNTSGITVESRVSTSDPWVQCTNGQPLPQFQTGSFNTGGIVYIKVTMSTTDASKFLPRLSFLAIKFYNNRTVFADNFGDTITSTSDYYLGSLNYPVLSRNETNGIRPKSGTGFNLTTSNNIKTVEMFFTPQNINTATTLFYDPTTGTKYAWNGSGTVSKASISKVYVNGVDKTSQTSISNFLVANEPHHIVLVFTAAVTGALRFNYETSGGGSSHLYNNITIYKTQLSNTQIQTHYDLYVGKPSVSISEPVITLTQLTPEYYNNDWIIIKSV